MAQGNLEYSDVAGVAVEKENPDVVLDINNLSVAFQKRDRQIKALHNINLKINRREIVGLVGESGCGKSLTSLSVMRLLPEGAGIIGGDIKIDGISIPAISEEAMRKIRGGSISMIFQEPMTSLNPLIQIGRQIEESLLLHRKLSSRPEIHGRIIDLLNSVGISDPEIRYRQFPFEFSGGMRQRVMIALALACNPKVIIADEPTTALDVTIQAQILNLLKQIRDDYHTAILLITHNMGVIADVADRVAVMYAGRIVEIASVDDLFLEPLHPYTVGLLKSIPDLAGDRTRELQMIPGSVPDLNNLPPGCAFHTRCPYAADICRSKSPVLAGGARNHDVACWNPMSRREC